MPKIIVIPAIVAAIVSGCSDREEITTGVILDGQRLEQFPAETAGLDISAPYWTPTAEQAFLADTAVLDPSAPDEYDAITPNFGRDK